jgi:hypothetical protein
MSPKARSLKTSGKRSFTIHNAAHVDGCPTKFSHADYTGRYNSHTPARAALKALNNLCKVKRIHGRCTLYIEMRETTQGSSHKVFVYKGKRILLDKPIEIGKKGEKGYRRIEHRNVVQSVKEIPTEKCKRSRKSSGRMLSRSSMSLKSKTHKSHKSRTSKKSMTKRVSNAVRKTVRKSIKRISKML